MIRKLLDWLLQCLCFGNKNSYSHHSKPKWKPRCWHYKHNYKSKQCAAAYENFCSDQAAAVAIASGNGTLITGRYSVPTSVGLYCEYYSDKIYCPYS